MLLGVDSSFILIFLEFHNQIFDRNFAMNLVISGSNVDGALLLLFVADNENKVVLCQLGVSNFFVDGQARIQFNVDLEAGFVELFGYLFGVIILGGSDGKNLSLAGR